MIYITIFQNQDGIKEFNCIGHAEYADAGEDIVCAAVSAIVINTINSLETFTSVSFQTVTNSQEGLIDVDFSEKLSSEADLLMKSMILGLQGIQEQYGEEFLRLDFREV